MKQKHSEPLRHLSCVPMELNIVCLSDDEVALIRKRSSPKESLLTAIRGIKVREIDKALVILNKGDRQP